MFVRNEREGAIESTRREGEEKEKMKGKEKEKRKRREREDEGRGEGGRRIKALFCLFFMKKSLPLRPKQAPLVVSLFLRLTLTTESPDTSFTFITISLYPILYCILNNFLTPDILPEESIDTKIKNIMGVIRNSTRRSTLPSEDASLTDDLNQLIQE